VANMFTMYDDSLQRVIIWNV